MHHPKIDQQLLALAEGSIKAFSSKLIPNIDNVLGIRVPHIRSLAKEVVKADWRSWLPIAPETYMEQVMLKGIVVATAKMELHERLEWLRWFIPKIDNWAVCDSTVMSIKSFGKHQAEAWEFIVPYCSSPHPYEVRFALVAMLSYFAEERYLPDIFKLMERIHTDDYYVKMGMAWTISVCFIKAPECTEQLFERLQVEDWVYNKAIQKTIESYRITDALKNRLRQQKRRATPSTR